jgi:hypothetical protein
MQCRWDGAPNRAARDESNTPDASSSAIQDSIALQAATRRSRMRSKGVVERPHHEPNLRLQ